MSLTVLIVPAFAMSVSAAAPKTVTYNLYFGDLHSHTSYSDAWEGTPWDAYAAAKAGGADFFAVTDHAQLWNGYSGFAISQAQLDDTIAAADHFTSRSFAGLYGYETWLLGDLGEINTYNVPTLPPYQHVGYKWDRPSDYYDWLAGQPGAVGMFNHPTYMSKNFVDFSYLTPKRDAVMGIVEVWNAKSYEPSYIMALDKGWHVMPSSNSDTHNPDWISGYEERTVLLAPKLAPADLYAAMKEGRGYATLDKNLRVSYTLNGEMMGSTLSQGTSAFTAAVHIEDPDGVASDAITLVEVVSDGGAVVASVPTNGTVVDLTIPLTSTSAHYYYLRISTNSPLGQDVPGVTAWTAAVWTGN